MALNNFISSLYKSYKKKINYIFEFKQFQKMSELRVDLVMNWDNKQPCLNDKTAITEFDRHYVYHTAWAARIVRDLRPKKHVDIASSLHFGTILSAFIPVEFYDYRPAILDLDNIKSLPGDLMSLPFEENSLESVSCMHVVEHIGLGRYGDPLNPKGDLLAIKELKRVVTKGGHLLFVTPVGIPRIMFNAHRIYSYEQIISYFEDFDLVEFSLIPDSEVQGGLVRNANPEIVKKQNYACGCFLFKKKL
jgi:hypothetical protein